MEWQDDSLQTIDATLRASFRKERDRIAFQPKLFVKTDSGAGIDLPCTVVAADGCQRIADQAFAFQAGKRDARVLITPDWSSLAVRPDLSPLRMDIAIVEFREAQNV